jgi:hypothetical protein
LILVKLHGKVVGEHGEIVEFDISNIPSYTKALLVEYHLKNMDRLVEGVDADLQSGLFKYFGTVHIFTEPNEIVLKPREISELPQNVRQLIENERSRQQDNYKKMFGGWGQMCICMIPSHNRTLASIFSTENVNRFNGATGGDEMGFLGSLENTLKPNNSEHVIHFLTPWWIWKQDLWSVKVV